MLHSQIISWYLKNMRDLPWRHTQDPYCVWISEIMLQQTRVATAITYYQRFMQSFPDVETLAKADEQEVLKHWQGLGYYSRARNLHYTSKDIVNNLNSQFPATYKELMKLKGVGTYTAAAIAAFAFNQPEVAVDGNVYRVLARLFGVATPIDTGKGKRQFMELAREVMDEADPCTFNQALIEFGALQCIPRSPKCNECPLQNKCYAHQQHLVEQFPVKSKTVRVRDRYFHFLFLLSENNIILEKRTGKDIWTNLFQYPLIETTSPVTTEAMLQSKEWQNVLGDSKINIKGITEPMVHKLSHQNLYIVFYNIELMREDPSKMKNYIKTNIQNLKQYPLPKPIENHLKRHISIK